MRVKKFPTIFVTALSAVALSTAFGNYVEEDSHILSQHLQRETTSSVLKGRVLAVDTTCTTEKVNDGYVCDESVEGYCYKILTVTDNSGGKYTYDIEICDCSTGSALSHWDIFFPSDCSVDAASSTCTIGSFDTTEGFCSVPSNVNTAKCDGGVSTEGLGGCATMSLVISNVVDSSGGTLMGLSKAGSDCGATVDITGGPSCGATTPSETPSAFPSTSPSVSPTTIPSVPPTAIPSVSPTTSPSVFPSTSPSTSPSASPNTSHSAFPSTFPTFSPSTSPSASPGTTTSFPSASPSVSPSHQCTNEAQTVYSYKCSTTLYLCGLTEDDIGSGGGSLGKSSDEDRGRELVEESEGFWGSVMDWGGCTVGRITNVVILGDDCLDSGLPSTDDRKCPNNRSISNLAIGQCVAGGYRCCDKLEGSCFPIPDDIDETASDLCSANSLRGGGVGGEGLGGGIFDSCDDDPSGDDDDTDDDDSSVDGPGGSGAACFSGEATAVIENKGTTPLKEIQVGDKVLTGSGSFETVYSINHKNPHKPTNFLQIYSNAMDSPLELTEHHLVFVGKEKKPIPASDIQVGDSIVTMEHNHCYSTTSTASMTTVTKISSITREGLYNPLTTDGTIVVDGIVTSTYSLTFGPKDVTIAGLNVMSHHDFIHLLLFPYQTICLYGMSHSLCESEEEYNGYSQLGLALLKFGHKQSAVVQDMMVLGLLGGFSILSFLLMYPFTCVSTLCLFAYYCVLSSDKNKRK